MTEIPFTTLEERKRRKTIAAVLKKTYTRQFWFEAKIIQIQ